MLKRAPVSRCEVPLQEIIHGGARTDEVKVFLCAAHHTGSPRSECVPYLEASCILHAGSAGIHIWGFFCLLVTFELYELLLKQNTSRPVEGMQRELGPIFRSSVVIAKV